METLLKWMIWGYHYFRKHPPENQQLEPKNWWFGSMFPLFQRWCILSCQPLVLRGCKGALFPPYSNDESLKSPRTLWKSLHFYLETIGFSMRNSPIFARNSLCKVIPYNNNKWQLLRFSASTVTTNYYIIETLRPPPGIQSLTFTGGHYSH